ncbi:Aste57867_22971 [Aphanomyces stellatus]|uniref:Aste57867_22971 protein n=1 Tax=Aphanomyces stellatus TaxID=120398 RepID=A0A485LLM4_9STRA|nr:hypothetical protein As57867_022900 [Aphanomyces stellatus]VFT99621.1 Aste57867_22971 [Aphanomyces stellatus]
MWASLEGPHGMVFSLTERIVRIGRKKHGVDVCIPIPVVSALHCTLERKGDGQVWLTDCSTHGVFLHGLRVGIWQSSPLEDGDEIYLSNPCKPHPIVLCFRLHTTNIAPIKDTVDKLDMLIRFVTPEEDKFLALERSRRRHLNLSSPPAPTHHRRNMKPRRQGRHVQPSRS